MTMNDLAPATHYSFQVSQLDEGEESPKSNEVTFVTHGIVILPITSQIVTLKGSIDPIGIENEGFDTGISFGGSLPITIDVLNNINSENGTTLEVPAEWNMGTTPAVLVGSNKYLAINENKSVEITTA